MINHVIITDIIIHIIIDIHVIIDVGIIMDKITGIMVIEDIIVNKSSTSNPLGFVFQDRYDMYIVCDVTGVLCTIIYFLASFKKSRLNIFCQSEWVLKNCLKLSFQMQVGKITFYIIFKPIPF